MPVVNFRFFGKCFGDFNGFSFVVNGDLFHGIYSFFKLFFVLEGFLRFSVSLSVATV